jgi:transcriptional regulator with XRE-family HTH domain
MIDPEEIPNRLRIARAGSGLSRAKAAQNIGVHERTLANWETGDTMIGLDMTLRLCDLYATNIGQLVGDIEFNQALNEIRSTNERLKNLEAVIERIAQSR